MKTQAPAETFREQTVTYTLEMDGHFYIVENVPARVCVQTGEQLFAPQTVEHLQEILRSQRAPTRIIHAA